MQNLIEGSADNNKSQQAAFFIPFSDSFEMHFCTSHFDEFMNNVQNWYCMNFGKDFVDILQTHKRLPFPSIEESMATINELQQEIDKLKAENEKLVQASLQQS